MDQFKRIWISMSVGQRTSIGVTLMAAVAALMWLSSWRTEAGFKPLYRGLDSTEAGDVVKKLKEAGVPFRLQEDGGTILIPSDSLNETRLLLAREGLPKTGRIGYEL
ncbi:MAG: hypothetical protein ABI824_18105, partial [Acidobacteriota bacterium]